MVPLSIQTLQSYRLVDSFDAAGMALFVITGTNVALSAANDFSAAIIGTISGVGGGMIRACWPIRFPVY